MSYHFVYQILTSLIGNKINFSRTVPDLYTADCYILPISEDSDKIKIAENV